MKPQLLKFTALLLILAGLATDCGPKCPDCPEPEVYPKEISFTEYSLEGTSCQWKNLSYNDKVLIINSSEEMGKYISCTDASYPAIDFSKQTLLLVSGKTNSGIYKLSAKGLQQLLPSKYELSLEIELFDNSNISEWSAAFLVEKLSKANNVELNVTLLSSPQELCYCIMDTLRGEWSWFLTETAFETTDNKFKSILKIFDQNEDASINYELFVEDTLFYRGCFQFLNSYTINIKLPHPAALSGKWIVVFLDINYVPNKNIMRFCIPGTDAHYFFYQKIQ